MLLLSAVYLFAMFAARPSARAQNLLEPEYWRVCSCQREDDLRWSYGSLENMVSRPCAQVDSALLAHPAVTEAVSFGAPDEKYGEVVAAAVVLAKPADDPEALVKDIQRVTSEKLAAFKARQLCHR